MNGMFPGAQLPPANYYSIDVECVATGTDHNSRAVGQISLVVSDPHQPRAGTGGGRCDGG